MPITVSSLLSRIECPSSSELTAPALGWTGDPPGHKKKSILCFLTDLEPYESEDNHKKSY